MSRGEIIQNNTDRSRLSIYSIVGKHGWKETKSSAGHKSDGFPQGMILFIWVFPPRSISGKREKGRPEESAGTISINSC